MSSLKCLRSYFFQVTSPALRLPREQQSSDSLLGRRAPAYIPVPNQCPSPLLIRILSPKPTHRTPCAVRKGRIQIDGDICNLLPVLNISKKINKSVECLFANIRIRGCRGAPSLWCCGTSRCREQRSQRSLTRAIEHQHRHHTLLSAQLVLRGQRIAFPVLPEEA